MSWLAGERLLRLAIGIVVGAYVARYLGPANFGTIGYVISFVGLFAIIATFGLDGVAVRGLVADPTQRDKILGTVFWLKVTGAVIAWVLLALSVPIVEADVELRLYVAIVATGLVFHAFNVIDFHYQSIVRSVFVVYAKGLQLIMTSALRVVLVLTEAHLKWFVLISLFEAIMLALGLIVFYVRSGENIFAWRWDWTMAKSLLRASWPLLFYGYFVTINMSIDTVMLRQMTDLETVGNYSVSVLLSTIWYFIPLAVGSTFFPYIISSKASPDYQRNLEILFGGLLAVSLLGSLFTVFVSDWVIGLLYGAQYADAAQILAIHIWTGIFVFHVSIRSRIMLTDNIQHLSLWFTALAAASNVLLNYLLIPHYGGVGAAYASLISWGLNVLVFAFCLGKTRNFVRIFFSGPIRLLEFGLANAAKK